MLFSVTNRLDAFCEILKSDEGKRTVSKIYDSNHTRWCDSEGQLEALVADVINKKDRADRFWIYCVNLYSLGLLEKHIAFRSAVASTRSVAVADGVIISVLAYLKRRPVRQRLTGHDVFDTILKTPTRNQLRCFFFGSEIETLNRIRVRLQRDYSEVICVGVLSPPISSDGLNSKDDEFIRIINDARPDVLFIGLTQPKQEVWINKHFESLDVPVAACIGAVFDFYARTKQRAPLIFRSLGLEWVFRIIEDPRKITNRFIYSVPAVIRYLFHGRSH